MTTPELRECPFCGSDCIFSDNKFIIAEGLSGVHCDDCGAVGPMPEKYGDGHSAITAWNRRAEFNKKVTEVLE